MFPIFTGFYVVIAFGIIVFWPLLCLEFFPGFIIILLILLNIGILIFSAFFSSGNFKNFYHSFRIIVAPTQSGCANITILYAIPLIIALYIYSFFLSLVGIFKGKQFSMYYWLKVVYRFNSQLLNRNYGYNKDESIKNYTNNIEDKKQNTFYCRYCGKELPNYAIYCKYCGEKNI